MSFLRTPASIASISLLLVSFIFAQPSDNCEKRAVIVSVRDNQGRPVRGLGPANFRAEIGKRPVRVLSTETGPSARRVLVMLDVSGSMISPPEKWRLARLLAGDLVAYASPTTQLALLTFSSEVRESQGFELGRTAFMEKIRSIENPKEDKGRLRGSALVDAIAKGLEILSPAQPGDSIYMITDGEDNQSRLKFRAVRQRLVAGNVRFFAFLLRDYPYTGLGPSADDFQDLARDSAGGVVNHGASRSLAGPPRWEMNPETQAAVSLAARILYQQMENTYRLEIETPAPADRKLNWRLEIINQQGNREKDLYVFYPRALPSCISLSGAR